MRPPLPAAAVAIAAAAAVSLLAGCGAVSAGAAATVGDHRIGVDELARRTDALFQLPGAKEALRRDDAQRRVLSELVGLAVDERLAARNGVTVPSADVDSALGRASTAAGGASQLQLQLITQSGAPAYSGADIYVRDALLLQGVLTKLVPATVPESALRQLYVQQAGQFRNAHLAHIVVADRATAELVLTKAKAAPDSFAALAAKYSTDQATKATGGDEGTQPRGTFTPTVEDAVYAAKPGDVIGPLEVNGGVEVIKVISVVDRSFEQARAELERAARMPQSPYVLSLLTAARSEEAQRLRVRTNPRFGVIDTSGGPSGFAVTKAPDVLSVPARGGAPSLGAPAGGAPAGGPPPGTGQGDTGQGSTGQSDTGTAPQDPATTPGP